MLKVHVRAVIYFHSVILGDVCYFSTVIDSDVDLSRCDCVASGAIDRFWELDVPRQFDIVRKCIEHEFDDCPEISCAGLSVSVHDVAAVIDDFII